MSNSDYAAQKLSLVNARVSQACENAGISAENITLIGASKKQAPSLIREFLIAGLSHLGENYLQEAIDKQGQLNKMDDNVAQLCTNWHFIGQIQSNKTKAIARHFSWVHGVDRLKIAKRLAQQHERDKPINLLIQLNPDCEDSKGGVSMQSAPELAMQIAQLEHARLRGFMMIPKARKSFDEQCRIFAEAKELLAITNQRYDLNLDQLSMGMSGDLEAAIKEGSTMIRVGTDLFGARSV